MAREALAHPLGDRAAGRVGTVRHNSSYLSEGLRPSDSPTPSLARRCAASLRSGGSLRSLAMREPHVHTVARSALRRLAPLRWLAALARDARPSCPHRRSLGAAPPRSAPVARCARSRCANLLFYRVTA